jgi:hypothetical protein
VIIFAFSSSFWIRKVGELTDSVWYSPLYVNWFESGI